MNREKTVSPGQLMLIFLLARIMHTMIFKTHGFSGAVPMMLGQLASTAAEAVLAIPAVIYFSRGGSDPAADIGGKHAVWIKLLYSLYFSVIAGATVALFTEFLTSEFSDTVTPYLAIFLIILAAGYCARGGIEGLGRSATVVFWLFVLLFAVMAAVNEGGFEWLNVTPMTSSDMPLFKSYFLESLSAGWWLPMLCALGGHLKKGAAKAAYGYLGIKLVIIEALLLMMSLVLWKYVDVLGYPLFALGAYAKSDFIQRFDAINMFVWAINCALVAGIYIFICAKPSGKNTNGAVALSSAATALAAAVAYKSGLRFDGSGFVIFKAAGIALLGVAAPAAALIKRNFGRRKA